MRRTDSDSDELVKATRHAEYSLIGAILTASVLTEVVEYLRDNLSPHEFYDADMKRYYQAALSCTLEPNHVNLAAELNRTGMLRSGDMSRLFYCISVCPCCLDYDHYAIQIKEYARQREPLITKGGVEI